MTLILAAMHRHAVVQVVDRLLTRRNGSQFVEFDPRSNKTVIFRARDGIAAISYTGLSYIDGTPTDQWIVEQITGREMADEKGGRVAALSCPGVPKHRWPSLGQAFTRLQENLGQAMRHLAIPGWGGEPVAFGIVGWQLYRRKRPRPIMVSIVKPKGRNQAAVLNYFHRHIGPGLALQMLPRQITGARLRTATAELTGKGLERVLVDTIREVAKENPTVGPDCMCVGFTRPSMGRAWIRFEPLNSAELEPGVSLNYLPWVVTQESVTAPSVRAGPGVLLIPHTAPWRLAHQPLAPPRRNAAPEPSEGVVVLLMASQRRPPQPKH